MTPKHLNDLRIERLQAAVDRLSGGNVTAFGRLLGYKDGAFVRQMLSGARAISEKTVAAIERLPDMENWFAPGAIEPPPASKVATGGTHLRAVASNTPKAAEGADLEVLRQVVVGVERGLSKRHVSLPPEKKADLIVLIYDHYLRSPSDDSGETVERYLRLVS